MKPVIEVTNLHREYRVGASLFSRAKKSVQALSDVSFEVRQGEVFGLLGPNGAGKTTTIKIMATLLAPTSGTVKVLGYDAFHDPVPIRQRINLIAGGERNLYWRLTGRHNLQYFADLYRVPRTVQKQLIPHLLEMVGLTQWADNRVETYSKGMKQRLQIARGLLNDPAILFLDEPSLGLDPVSAQELRGLIVQLRSQGKTIILTTHYMFEADYLCDRIGIINKGKLVALDTPAQLKQLASGLSVVEIHTRGVNPAVIKELRVQADVSSLHVRSADQRQILEIQTHQPEQVWAVVTSLLPTGMVLRSQIREATLEDAYIKLVGG